MNNIASDEERKKYLLKTEQDYEILDLIHKLESKNLSQEDKELISFIRTQLEDDWRTPIVEFLNKLLKKYKSN